MLRRSGDEWDYAYTIDSMRRTDSRGAIPWIDTSLRIYSELPSCSSTFAFFLFTPPSPSPSPPVVSAFPFAFAFFPGLPPPLAACTAPFPSPCPTATSPRIFSSALRIRSEPWSLTSCKIG